MLNAADIYALIETRRSELGLSRAQLGQLAFGQGNSAANQNLRRGSVPAADRLGSLADALGLELYFGPKRETATPPPAVEIDGEEFAAVVRLGVEASAGAGAFNEDAQIVGKLAFRHDWLRKLGVKPDSAMLITVTGHSMEPTLHPDDIVLVNTARKDVVASKVYALIDLDGATRIKRLFKPDAETLVLASDNRDPSFAPELRRRNEINRLNILGRVVWSGHNWS